MDGYPAIARPVVSSWSLVCFKNGLISLHYGKESQALIQSRKFIFLWYPYIEFLFKNSLMQTVPNWFLDNFQFFDHEISVYIRSD